MPKDSCPSCDGEKDTRSKQCRSCQFKYNHPRLGTGSDWYLHKGTGYKVKYINGVLSYEHKYLVEGWIGRPLMQEECVHHKDGDKCNNNFYNLKLMTKLEHHKLHSDSDRMRRLSKLGHAARWRE